MNKIRLMLSDSTEALNDINVLQFKYCIKLFKKWSLIEYYKIFQFLEYYKDVFPQIYVSIVKVGELSGDFRRSDSKIPGTDAELFFRLF